MIYKRLHTHLKSFLTIPVRSFSQSYDDHKEARHLVNHRDAFKFHFNRFQKRHDSVSVNQHLGDVLGMRQGFRTSDSQYNQWRDLVLNKQTQLDDKKFAQALNNLLMFGIVDVKLWQFLAKQVEVRFWDMKIRDRIICCYYPTKNIQYNEHIFFSEHLIRKSFEDTRDKERFKRYDFDDLLKTAYCFHNWGIDVNILLDHLILTVNNDLLDTKIQNTNNNLQADAAYQFSHYDKDQKYIEAFFYGFQEQGQQDTDKMLQNYEQSGNKTQEFGEYDARLWESMSLISEVMRKEGYLQYDEIYVIECAIHEKSENHLIDIKSAANILSNIGVYMKKRGPSMILFMQEEQIREEIDGITLQFNSEVCLKLLDGLSQMFEMKQISQENSINFMLYLRRLQLHSEFYKTFDKSDVEEVQEEQNGFVKIGVMSDEMQKEIMSHCDRKS